jgi:hypothetical protein
MNMQTKKQTNRLSAQKFLLQQVLLGRLLSEHSVCWKVCLSGEKYNKAEKQSQERLQRCKI